MAGVGISKGVDEYNTFPNYSADTIQQNAETFTRYYDFGYSYWGIESSVQMGLIYKSVGLQMGYSREFGRFAENITGASWPRIQRISFGLVTTFWGK